jgi:hypothetical protein
MWTVEERANIKPFVLLYRYTVTLRRLEDTYSKAAMKKIQVYSGINVFVIACLVSMKIRNVNFWQLRQHGAWAQCCAKWPTKEYSGDISGSRNISWKHSQYSSERFEHGLPLPTLDSKNANSSSKKYLAKHNATVRIAGFLDFVHRPEFWILEHTNVSETGSVSILRRRQETPTRYGPLEIANLYYWATHVI